MTETLERSSSSSLVDYYLTDVWNVNGDPRTKEYPLMGTFKTPLVIYLAYLTFVLYLGPALMRNRKPFNLKWIIIPYNLILSALNLLFFLKLVFNTNYGRELLNVSFRPTKETTPRIIEGITWSYLYLLSKYVDKLDTIFFILRKKQSQVTGLHVYHHSMVPLMGWVYFRTNAFHVTGATFAFLNAPIHTIMYAYYGLAAFGPHMQPYLWWKRYITQIQIFQFVLLFAHGMYFCLFQSGYSLFFSVDILFQSSLYFILFTRFYFKSYSKKESSTKKIN